MELVTPQSLDSVRVYFTGLDLRLVVDGGEAGVQDLTRRLKLLSMLKGHVVVAASHLVESMSVFPFLQENPKLFSHGVVVPALRQEFTTVVSFVGSTDPLRRTSWVGVIPVEDAANLIDSTARFAIRWDVNETSSFFTRLVVDHVLNSESLIRSTMPDVSQVLAEKLVVELGKSARLSRDDVSNCLNLIPSEVSRNRLRRFADLAYYVAGAKAVESVGILPQENLVRFDYGSSVRRPRLSEWDIFFNHCANAIFAASGPRILPEDLDKLAIDDILAFRDRWVGPRFREKYNRILTLCRERTPTRDPHNMILRLDELETLSRELTSQYSKAAARERLLKKISNTGMSILSLLVSGVLDTADYAVTGLEVIGDWIDTDRSGEGMLARVKGHVQAARDGVGDHLAINQELTRFLEALMERVRSRVT